MLYLGFVMEARVFVLHRSFLAFLTLFSIFQRSGVGRDSQFSWNVGNSNDSTRHTVR